jgi:hypothetical protein
LYSSRPEPHYGTGSKEKTHHARPQRACVFMGTPAKFLHFSGFCLGGSASSALELPPCQQQVETPLRSAHKL